MYLYWLCRSVGELNVWAFLNSLLLLLPGIEGFTSVERRTAEAVKLVNPSNMKIVKQFLSRPLEKFYWIISKKLYKAAICYTVCYRLTNLQNSPTTSRESNTTPSHQPGYYWCQIATAAEGGCGRSDKTMPVSSWSQEFLTDSNMQHDARHRNDELWRPYSRGIAFLSQPSSAERR